MTFQPGAESEPLCVDVLINDDTLCEGAETFSVNAASGPDGGSLIISPTSTVTIIDNDGELCPTPHPHPLCETTPLTGYLTSLKKTTRLPFPRDQTLMYPLKAYILNQTLMYPLKAYILIETFFYPTSVTRLPL